MLHKLLWINQAITRLIRGPGSFVVKEKGEIHG